MAREPYALSARILFGLVRGRPEPMRGTRMRSSTGRNWGESPALASGDDQRQRLLALLDREVQLGRQAATGASESVVGRLVLDAAGFVPLQIPLLRAPAACWWARATVESTLTSQVIRPCASAPV